MGKTGNIIQGHVLDSNKKHLERALKDYDKQLYIRWNPKKVKGFGCWEVRRKPEFKTIVDYCEFEGHTILDLDYVEVDAVHHVLDAAFLNYQIVEKIKDMDTLASGHADWAAAYEHAETVRKEEFEKKRLENRSYMLKQMRKDLNWFREYVLSGNDPGLIGQFWGQDQE